MRWEDEQGEESVRPMSVSAALNDLKAHQRDYQQAIDGYHNAIDEMGRAGRNVRASRSALALAIKRECGLSDAALYALGQHMQEASS